MNASLSRALLVPALLACAPAFSAAPSPAVAATLRSAAQWCGRTDHINLYMLRCAVTSNSSSRVARHADGILKYNASTNRLEGTVRQYFNDRRAMNEPFNPKQTDELMISLDCATGQATLTLKSWGNGRIGFPLREENGILFGFASEGAPALWAFSLKQERQDILR